MQVHKSRWHYFKFKGFYAKLVHPGYSAIGLILVTVASLRGRLLCAPEEDGCDYSLITDHIGRGLGELTMSIRFTKKKFKRLEGVFIRSLYEKLI